MNLGAYTIKKYWSINFGFWMRILNLGFFDLFGYLGKPEIRVAQIETDHQPKEILI